MMALAIFFSYAIQFYVPVDIINSYLQERISVENHIKAEYLVRLVLVLFTFTLAAVIPKLDLFISLVGSVSSSTLALMAPSIIDTVTAGESCSRWGEVDSISFVWKYFTIFPHFILHQSYAIINYVRMEYGCQM